MNQVRPDLIQFVGITRNRRHGIVIFDDVDAMLQLIVVQRQHHVNPVGHVRGGQAAGMVEMRIRFQRKNDFRGAFDRHHNVLAVMPLRRKIVRGLQNQHAERPIFKIQQRHERGDIAVNPHIHERIGNRIGLAELMSLQLINQGAPQAALFAGRERRFFLLRALDKRQKQGLLLRRKLPHHARQMRDGIAQRVRNIAD